MTQENFTAIAVVLDRSGSMNAIRDDTIGGFNTFLAQQKEAEGDAVFTLAQFDNEYEVVHDFVDINDVPELDAKTFVPRGGTALLDGIGRTITELGAKLDNMVEEDKPSSVVVVVLTDGEENQSREYTRDQIFEMITEQTEKYSWEFIFLGAGQDAIAVGQSYGFAASKAASYSIDSMVNTFASVSKNVAGYRATRSAGGSSAAASKSLDFSQEDRDEIS